MMEAEMDRSQHGAISVAAEASVSATGRKDRVVNELNFFAIDKSSREEACSAVKSENVEDSLEEDQEMKLDVSLQVLKAILICLSFFILFIHTLEVDMYSLFAPIENFCF